MTDDDDNICPVCNGSGEGQYDGTRCHACNGSGVERGAALYDDDGFDPPEDHYAKYC